MIRIASIWNNEHVNTCSLKKCECGYDPSHRSYADFLKYMQCPIRLALRNHISFPSVDFISDYNDPSTLYHNYHGHVIYASRHWATYFEIVQDSWFLRPRVIGRNQFGEELAVHFYPDDMYEMPSTFSWTNLKPGYTMCILYPEKKIFLDFTEGIRQEHLDLCFIFLANLETVQNEAQKLLNDADTAAANGVQESECFTCGTKKAKMSRCGNCGLARYCSKVKNWLENNRNRDLANFVASRENILNSFFGKKMEVRH